MADLLIVLLGTTMLYLFAASRLEGYVRTLSIQGALLFALVVVGPHDSGWLNVAFLVFETLVVKTIALPYLILRVIRRNEIGREVEPNISQFYSILIATAIFGFGFAAAFWAAGKESGIQPLFFGVSTAIIISSLFLVISRKRIVTHILSYMVLENGIFLLSLSVANEMPLLVNLGVLLDLFIAVFLLVVFFNKISEMFDGDHIDVLTELKD